MCSQTLRNATTITSFDLYMSKTRFNTFAFFIHFINGDEMLCHIIVGLFEIRHILKQHWLNKLNPCWLAMNSLIRL